MSNQNRTAFAPFEAKGRQLIRLGQAFCNPETTVEDLVVIAHECGFRTEIGIFPRSSEHASEVRHANDL